MTRADIAIIGAGPGGYVAALRAAQLDAEVVCIERDRVGGVCLNWGCIPTKSLLRSAEIYALAKEAEEFGVVVGEPQVDWQKMQKRKTQAVEQLVNGTKMLLDRAGVTVIKGEASFARGHVLRVQSDEGEETVEADNIIIATGSRPLRIPIPGLDNPRVVDSKGALSLDRLPESICIIGGGAIGIEFASLFNTLGVDVTLVELLPHLAPLMDASIGEGLAWSFEQKGIEILTDTRVTGLENAGVGLLVHMEGPDGEKQIEVERALSAVGCAPNVENLGLEVLRLNPMRQGIDVDDRMRTAVPDVYAIGDVAADGPMLAHVASHQGIVAVEDAMGLTAAMDYTAVPSCIFSMPEAASVGLSEQEAREQGYDVEVGTFALANNGKAVTMGETGGFIKIVAEAEYDAVLGVHIVGPHASDLILENLLGINLEVTLDEIEDTIHPHPTLGEAIGEAALAVHGRALQVPG
ncbi:MAG: dihydrolipoyl dehydrogenase [Anaerolineales bacterium]